MRCATAIPAPAMSSALIGPPLWFGTTPGSERLSTRRGAALTNFTPKELWSRPLGRQADGDYILNLSIDTRRVACFGKRSTREAHKRTLVHPYPGRKEGGRFSVVRDGSRRLFRDGEHRYRSTVYRGAQGAGAAIQSWTLPTAIIHSEHQRATEIVLRSRVGPDALFAIKTGYLMLLYSWLFRYAMKKHVSLVAPIARRLSERALYPASSA